MAKQFRSPWAFVQIAALAIALIFWMTSCQGRGIISSAPFETVCTQTLEAAGAEQYPPMDPQRIRRTLGIEPDEFTQIMMYRIDDAFEARELAIVTFEGNDVRERAKEVLEARQAMQSGIYEGYAPTQMQMTDDALINVQGNYALYYVGDSSDAVNKAFMDALRRGDGQ